MKSNEELYGEVEGELAWEPSLDESDILLHVKDGVVTLGGHVPTYPQRRAAVRAAERVSGVKAVADELEVQLVGSHVRDDTDIAASIVQLAKHHFSLPEDLKVEVSQGVVTLRGTVSWEFQRKEATRLVRGIIGVQGLKDLIELRPSVRSSTPLEARIASALRRQASLEARQIHVAVHDSTAVLSGHVHSLAEERAATKATYGAPGITKVESHLTIEAS